MRVLIVGSGGREHALAWRLEAEGHRVAATPGNPGIGECFALPEGGVAELAGLWGADLVVFGPENPLIEGQADAVRAAGIPVFGPGAAGARLEASKAFSKAMMVRAGVPTAASGTFTTVGEGQDFARGLMDAGRGVVVKASGAALGKGVVVCADLEEAMAAIEGMLSGSLVGEAGREIVIEERLAGREFSLLTVVSGLEYRSLPVAQDYKRVGEGDTGPNTGGMGTYSPVGWLDDEVVARTEREVVEPMLRQLAAEGIEYRGVLFSGLMVDEGRAQCLEYNVRFGDPETQTVMRRVTDGLGELLLAAAEGRALPDVTVSDEAAVTVVVASGGYPGDVEKGHPITLGAMPEETVVFHAGTAVREGQLVTSGGRVLGVSATGMTLAEARARAYAGVGAVRFEGMQFRGDIGV